MKTLVLTLPAIALLASCGGASDSNMTVTDSGAAIEMPAGTGNGAVANSSMNAQQFVDAAASNDAYEIAAGRLAQQKGTTQAVKDFGTMMVRHHGESTTELRAAANKASPALVPSELLSDEQRANLQLLREADGEAFDTAYRAQQVAAHQQALAMLEAYAAKGDSPELRGWAEQTAPVVRAHLEKVQVQPPQGA